VNGLKGTPADSKRTLLGHIFMGHGRGGRKQGKFGLGNGRVLVMERVEREKWGGLQLLLGEVFKDSANWGGRKLEEGGGDEKEGSRVEELAEDSLAQQKLPWYASKG